MPVMIRLCRKGARSAPFWRIIAQDKRRPVRGAYLDHFGTYDQRVDSYQTKHLRLNIPRLKYWISAGATPTDAICKLMSRFGLLPTPPPRGQQTMPFDAEVERALAGQGCSKTPTYEQLVQMRGGQASKDGQIAPQTSSSSSSSSTEATDSKQPIVDAKTGETRFFESAPLPNPVESMQTLFQNPPTRRPHELVYTPQHPPTARQRVPRRTQGELQPTHRLMGKVPLEAVLPGDKTLTAWQKLHANKSKIKYPEPAPVNFDTFTTYKRPDAKPRDKQAPV